MRKKNPDVIEAQFRRLSITLKNILFKKTPKYVSSSGYDNAVIRNLKINKFIDSFDRRKK